MLSIIYENEIDKLNDHNISQTVLFNRKYESIDIKFKEPINFPFTGVLDKKEGCLYQNNISFKLDYKQRKYKNLIKRTIRKPKKIGYMLSSIDLNNSTLKCYCGTYEQNLYTSHYLEYELYLLYKHRKKYHVEELIQSKNREKLLSLLPSREKIHRNINQDKSILLLGDNRYSLLGIQAMVLIKNPNNSYDVLKIRRGTNVTSKPGFIQFIPSGGFEIFENKDDFDSKYANFSLSKAVFKEIMEECFNTDEALENEHISSEHIYTYPEIKELIKLINTNKAEFKLLGSSMSLVSLRHELSFILKIDDIDFAQKLACNYQSSGVISQIDLKNLLDINFWDNYSKSGTYNDLKKLNATSASLFNLVLSYLNIKN